jgi:CheY-like chemotaxis protein
MTPTPISLLIVDDDPVFARFVTQLVRVIGRELACTSTWVDSAEKALGELRGGRYDLALVDYNLPGSNGLALLAAIQEPWDTACAPRWLPRCCGRCWTTWRRNCRSRASSLRK